MHQLKRHVVMPGVASEDRSNTWRGLGPLRCTKCTNYTNYNNNYYYYTGTVELE